MKREPGLLAAEGGDGDGQRSSEGLGVACEEKGGAWTVVAWRKEFQRREPVGHCQETPEGRV